MRLAGFAVAVVAILTLLTACGGKHLTGQDWSQAVSGAGQVDASLHAGSYDVARATWKPVDNLIHATYPKLKKRDRKLADLVWYNMGIVEIGFFTKDWNLAEQGASALPNLLIQAHRVWRQAR